MTIHEVAPLSDMKCIIIYVACWYNVQRTGQKILSSA